MFYVLKMAGNFSHMHRALTQKLLKSANITFWAAESFRTYTIKK